jgi:heme-degrading monooxygenase HmoA
MIARTWSARTTPAHAAKYAAHLRDRVIPEIERIDGYQGAMLLEREAAEQIEMTVITYWRSLDAIRAFAGDDLERAVVADEAAALLTDFDRRVTHWRVVAEDPAP